MKLIITGASGFVATEVLRQALLLPSITTVIAIARKSVSSPPGIKEKDASKLKSLVVPDYGTYSDDVKRELAGADACIWTVAITPSKAKGQDPDLVRKVCQEWTITGLNTMLEANRESRRKIKFLYMSGAAAIDKDRPRSKDVEMWTPASMAVYGKMRGKITTMLFDIAEEHPDQVEICVAKPGWISDGGVTRGLFGTLLWATGIVDTIHIKEVSAAMLHHAVNGFEGTDGVLLNSEMVGLGRKLGRR